MQEFYKMYMSEQPDRRRGLLIVLFLLLCAMSAGIGFIWLQDGAPPLVREGVQFGQRLLHHPGRVILPVLLFVLAIFSLFIFARLFMRLGNRGIVLLALAIMGASIAAPRPQAVYLQGGMRCLVIGGGGGGGGGGISHSAAPAPAAPAAAPAGMAGGNS